MIIMNSQQVFLHIDILLFGLESKRIDFEYKKDQLSAIDKLTYFYRNEEEFFESKKEELMNKIKAQSALYNLQIQPVNIELGSNKIYIQKGEKKIHPMFQELQVKNQTLKLEDIIKKRMINGSLNNLFKCDKNMQAISEYQSIFEGCSEIVLDKLELNLCDKEDIDYLFAFFKSKNRAYSIFRLLLLKESAEDMEKKMITDLPFVEIEYTKPIDNSSKLERYRWPYYDN